MGSFSGARASLFILSTLLCLVGCLGKIVTYDFNVSWVTANPDGLQPRKIVGINGQWPLPIIEVNKGDQLVVNMYNGLGDENASIHFHGMYQNGTNEMDGAGMLTQCPIPPDHNFTYNFAVNQNGTYWYHCHVDNCYPDGYRQALIVHDQDSFFHKEYEEEFTITMSDWYHQLAEDLAQLYISPQDSDGTEPIPNSFLVNDTQNMSIPVRPSTTYMFRLINIGAFVSQYVYIEDHTFQIVEIDGVYTEPAKAEMLYITPAQRYSILLTTKESSSQNYGIVTVADSSQLDNIPSDLQLNYTNWLEYNRSAPHPQANIAVNQSSDLVPFDDFNLVPYDHMPLLPEPDHVINVSVIMANVVGGAQYAFINNITYTAPKVPTLYTAMSSGEMTTNQEIYGDFTHSVVLKHNEVVELILNNDDDDMHPFHLHGHNFQVIDRAPPYGSNFYAYDNGSPVGYNPQNHSAFPQYPARRDTFALPGQGYFVIRFVADNPGVWLFHCHVDWHLSDGLAMVMVEAPDQLQQRSSIPQQHYDICHANGIPTQGNAAANTTDLLNLTSQNTQPQQTSTS